MNMLSEALLGLLVNEPLSGYDLMLKMNLFWHTRHSQIYPLLAELEKGGYVNFQLIKQLSKPDKKVYTITKSGIEIVKQWLMQDTNMPMNKDEMLLKAFCINILDEVTAKKLIKAREEMYKIKFTSFEERIHGFKEEYGEMVKSTDSPYFGRFILLNKVLGDAKWGIEWCRWVYSLYDSEKPINIFEENPFA